MIKDKNDDITSYTPWFYSKPNGGWRFGVRVMKWASDNHKCLQIQRFRTNKQRQWVPLKRKYLMIPLNNVRDLFDGETGVVSKVLFKFAEARE